jgi:hypothetical protein
MPYVFRSYWHALSQLRSVRRIITAAAAACSDSKRRHWVAAAAGAAKRSDRPITAASWGSVYISGLPNGQTKSTYGSLPPAAGKKISSSEIGFFSCEQGDPSKIISMKNQSFCELFFLLCRSKSEARLCTKKLSITKEIVDSALVLLVQIYVL